MSDATKKRLIEVLATASAPIYPNEWALRANVSRPTVMRHIPKLREQGYLRTEIGHRGGILYSLKKGKQVPDGTVQFNAALEPISKEYIFETIQRLRKSSLVTMSLKAQQLPLTVVRLLEQALVAQEGRSVSQETLDEYRIGLNEYRELLSTVLVTVERFLSTPELWSSERLGAYISYEISPQQLIYAKDEARWNVEKAISAIRSVMPDNPE